MIKQQAVFLCDKTKREGEFNLTPLTLPV